MKKKSIVLLSGGLDSSVNLASAVQDTEVILALTFDYGQKAALKEIESSKKLSEHYKIKHCVLELPWFKEFKSGLTDASSSVPTGTQVVVDDLATSQKTAKAVWVPNRNGIFLNIAAGFAESLGANVVVPGFNKEEAITFPDNSFDFMRALRKTFSFSTSNHVDVNCYTIQMDKTEIVKMGRDLRLPFEFIWPCYLSGKNWCGQCESCQRAKRAFTVAHVNVNHLFEV